jgi:hypothetical protein
VVENSRRKAARQQSSQPSFRIDTKGGTAADDALKHSFLWPNPAGHFLRRNAARPNKTLLFLFAPLTIDHAVAKSSIRFCLDRIAGFAIFNNKKLAACAAKQR